MSIEEHSHHVIPVKHLFATLMKLTALMILTIVAARVTPIDNVLIANIVAVTIACVKAMFVISIFMGVRYSTGLTKLFAIGGFVWLILMGGILIDYGSRQWEPVPGWEPGSPSTSIPRNVDRAE